MWGREESEVGVFYRFLLCHLSLAVTLNGKPWVLLRGSLYMIPDSRVQPPLFWSGVGTALASLFPPPCAFLCEQPFINLFSSYNFIALSVPCQDLGWHNVSIKSLLTFDLIFFSWSLSLAPIVLNSNSLPPPQWSAHHGLQFLNFYWHQCVIGMYHQENRKAQSQCRDVFLEFVF